MQYSDDDNFREAPKQHKPVLLEEVVKILSPRDGKTYLDCTFGGGGHTRRILESADCKVVSLDRDPAAIERAKAVSADYPDRFEFRPLAFSDLDMLGGESFAGILFDFGVSSFQLDTPERGFSFMREGPLDMRMDTTKGFTAREYIESADESELVEILREYGEEPRARKIARAIIAAREAGKISTTAELAKAIAEAAPSHERIHPATRAFQALRIKVNDELGEIERALPKAFAALESGGVMAAISFHSFEDRIVKKFFKKAAGRPEDRFDTSFVQDRVKLAELLTRKPILPSEEETANNPRSRSAKLRAIRKD
ncbi:16S rRNA (cytosine(1402)-N(4))-methyltransferase RsmH [Opitutia bacterium KCR 482]|nr:16S rRNA (cytosine(1402)-N(4))-methyltransferase RsmH [Opitutae bacterium KCR 482]